MPILQQQASDVRIQEINLSSVITSASSAVACQVVVSNQGRSDTPQRFTNGNDYLTEYGNPNAQIGFDVYCGLDFFREGNQMWSIRCVGTGALYSALLLYSSGTGASKVTNLLPITAGITDPTDIDWAGLLPDPADEAIALFYPLHGQGSFGDDLGISITSNNIDSPTGLAVTSSNSGGSLPSATYSYQIACVTSTGETLVSAPVVVVIAGPSVINSTTLTWNPVPLALGYIIYGRTANSSEGFIAQVGQGVFTFTDTGAITPDITHLPITNPSNLPAADPTFTVNVFSNSVAVNTPVENFDCTLTSFTDDNGAATELTERINPFSQFIQVVSNVPNLLDTPTVTSSTKQQLDGGNSGAAPTAFQIANAYSVFSNKQLYAVNSLINSGRPLVVQQAMDALVQARGDAVALLDVPSASQKFQDAINYRNLQLNLNSSYSALFNPDVQEADNINGKLQYVPFSGWAAALCARTDRVANPSFSIAGLNRGLVGVIQSRYTYDDGQSTAMFQAQVNYTRSFVGQGIALWEQQTLAAQQSALSWLSVRRIVNVIKVSLYKFLLYSLQEPNDDFTGRQIVGSCSDYLQTIQDARGISGYTVVSDSSNNTAAMINSAIRRVTVIIIPTLPIHEIQLQVVISKQGVTFSEVLQSVSGQ